MKDFIVVIWEVQKPYGDNSFLAQVQFQPLARDWGPVAGVGVRVDKLVSHMVRVRAMLCIVLKILLCGFTHSCGYSIMWSMALEFNILK